MRRFYRLFWLPVYRMWALRYIRRARTFRYGSLRLLVPPGVFHPGVFFSTPIFLDFLQHTDFARKTVLDIGTGSGALALFAAQKGGLVTAIDINPQAVDATLENARLNGLQVEAVCSDLWDRLPVRQFNFVLVNPPFYPKAPANAADYAFFAGENLEYFERLFSGLPAFLAPDARCWMILSEDCDLKKIRDTGAAYGFRCSSVFLQKKWGERLEVFEFRLS